jgi:SnoaL-like domain
MTDTRISIEEAAARMEIVALFTRYCHAVDRTEWDLFNDVFTDDVIADYGSVSEYTEGVGTVHGRAELVSWFEASMAHIGPGLTHYMTNHLIEMDGDEAQVTVHNHVLNAGMGGVYHCRAVSTPDGWRLASLRFEARYFDDVLGRMNTRMGSVDGRSV